MTQAKHAHPALSNHVAVAARDWGVADTVRSLADFCEHLIAENEKSLRAPSLEGSYHEEEIERLRRTVRLLLRTADSVDRIES